MICTACQKSDTADRATLAVANLILCGTLPRARETFLIDGNLIIFDKLDGRVLLIAVMISKTQYCFPWPGICALWAHGGDIGAGLALLQVGRGVGTKWITQTAIHALATALADGQAIFILDVKNAFNSISGSEQPWSRRHAPRGRRY